jgi:hypothetical protein
MFKIGESGRAATICACADEERQRGLGAVFFASFFAVKERRELAYMEWFNIHITLKLYAVMRD